MTDRSPGSAPKSTYRLQIRPEFGFDQVAELAGYLAELGISHAYLSPILTPNPGSQHGYDVIDHRAINPEAGGRPAFQRMVAALAERGLQAIADVVPNHMAVPTPERLNAALWSVLRDGPASPYANWFDVDWSVPSRALLMPVLGKRIGAALAAGDVVLDRGAGPEPVLRYYEHEFPVRPGTEDLPLEELVDQQWYRLAWWRVADDELNYRRFFDVGTLAALRVEDAAVFDATHDLLIELVRSGQLTGLRIDHPDGLADPRGYLRRLAERTGGAWVVVEKILSGHEQLPGDWPCAGTTGYDSLLRVGGLFLDPAGAAPLSALLAEMTGDPPEFEPIAEESKRQILRHSLYAETERLLELLLGICADDITLRDHTRRHLAEAVIEVLVSMDRYRAYVVPGEPAPPESVAAVERAAELARSRVSEEAAEAVDLVRDLALARPVGRPEPPAEAQSGDPRAARRAELRRDFVVRFQQTCGPVMAKGVEDTAFYRWHRLVALNEVGGEPGRFGVPPEEFHAFAGGLQQDWPTTMTTLSTHDTKRSEDVRARLSVLAEVPQEWAEAVREWTDLAAPHRTGENQPDGAAVYLLWQTLVGLWGSGSADGSGPPSVDRITDYLAKATREAKRHTSWTSPDEAYDESVAQFARGVLGDPVLCAAIGRFCASIAGPARVAVLGQKLVQLTMPGVCDVYQGTEVVSLTLVDPDNRGPVDFAGLRERLARLDSGGDPTTLDDEKLLVTSRALRLRRERPEWFIGPDAGYRPLATSTGNAVGFGRGNAQQPEVGAITVATRLPVALDRLGGWGEHTIALPEGRWRDLLTNRELDGGSRRLVEVLAALPVALLAQA